MSLAAVPGGGSGKRRKLCTSAEIGLLRLFWAATTLTATRPEEEPHRGGCFKSTGQNGIISQSNGNDLLSAQNTIYSMHHQTTLQ